MSAVDNTHHLFLESLPAHFRIFLLFFTIVDEVSYYFLKNLFVLVALNFRILDFLLEFSQLRNTCVYERLFYLKRASRLDRWLRGIQSH